MSLVRFLVASKAEAYPSEVPVYGRFLALPTNIRLSRRVKGLAGTNTSTRELRP